MQECEMDINSILNFLLFLFSFSFLSRFRKTYDMNVNSIEFSHENDQRPLRAFHHIRWDKTQKPV